MKHPKLQKTAEFILVLLIIAASVAVFIFREEVKAIGGWGYGGLFLLCFLSKCTVFLPAPSLPIAFSFAEAYPLLAVTTVGAAGTALGELTGYLLGRAGRNLSPTVDRIFRWLSARIKHTDLWIFLFALLPIPFFDLAGIYAGGERLPPWRFTLLCFAGKWLKMLAYTAAFRAVLPLLPLLADRLTALLPL